MIPPPSLAGSLRRHPLLIGSVVLGYLGVYLLAIQNLVVARSLRADLPGFELLPDWGARLTEPIAPFYFEPVAALYLTGRLTLLISPLNMVMGLLLAGLVAANLAVAVEAYRHSRACRNRTAGGLLGALPGFLTGFACCVPSLALVLGAQVTTAVIALRSWFFPVAVAVMSASLWWNLRSRRLTTAGDRLLGGEGPGAEAVPVAAGLSSADEGGAITGA